jgi:hypothetical protein
MKILAIDPGSQSSAWVLWDGSRLLSFDLTGNESVLRMLESRVGLEGCQLYIEMIGHYGRGMPAGREVFDTCVWIGRFTQAWKAPCTHVLRPTVKTHICGASNANDANVRQAVWDRFGGRKAAVGTKKQPGPLYGVVKDIMQAFALALYVSDTEKNNRRALPEIEAEGKCETNTAY